MLQKLWETLTAGSTIFPQPKSASKRPASKTGKSKAGQNKAAPAKKGQSKKMTSESNPGASSGESSSSPQKQNGAKNSQKSLDSKRSKTKIIERSTDIPKHDEVLTTPEGPLDISESLRRRYIALLSKTEPEIVYLISSSEMLDNDRKVDHNLIYIQEACSAAGHRNFKRLYANPSIIQIVYEQSKKISKKEKTDQKDSLIGKVYDLFDEALKKNATDVHIEVRDTHAQVRFRVNSRLSRTHEWRIDETTTFAGLIYRVVANSDDKDISFNPKKQQTATLNLNVKGVQVRVRLNTMPAFPGGFDMVMRILRMGSSTGDVNINSLGYSKDQVEKLRLMTAQPTGVIIVSGVTGSGKSTTNSVLLTEVIAKEMTPDGCGIKVITVEDPPEYEIPHSTQYPVNANIGESKNAFAEAMKAALRCDPDILMVGEVRDADSAHLLVHAVQSGHQVYTTLHAQSAFSIVPRLAGIGVDPSVLGTAGFLSGLVYQSLLPSVCGVCARSYSDYQKSKDYDPKLDDRLTKLEALGYGSVNNLLFRNPEGCDECKRGIKGMTVVAETIVPNEDMCELFGEGRINEARRLYRMEGGQFIIDHGIQKVFDQYSCPVDAEGKLGPLIASSTEAEADSAKEKPTPSGSAKKNKPIRPRSEIREEEARDQGKKNESSEDGHKESLATGKTKFTSPDLANDDQAGRTGEIVSIKPMGSSDSTPSA